MLAIGVAALDSLTLLFVAAHFSFLLYCQGHLWTLRAAETKYQSEVAEYNARADKISAGNNDIARAAERIAEIEKQTERLRNDTVYWSRKNGVKPSQSGVNFQWTPSKVELPPAPTPPPESSASFLARWDWWIRVAGFGELALSIITLIFVRTRTAARNRIAPREADDEEEFPDELDVENQLPIKRGKFIKKKETAKGHGSFNSEGLKRLRDALRVISFRLHKRSFKSAVRGDAVWIYLVRANHGTQETITSAKAKLSLLDDAVKMAPEAFRDRLERFLRENGFEI